MKLAGQAFREYRKWADYLSWLGGRDPRVRYELEVASGVFGLGLAVGIRTCESPIEEVLGLALQCANYMHPFVGGDELATITAQKTVKTSEGEFRVDFLVTESDGSAGGLVIECDGHEFHERTKEQAERDKRRDRALKLAGYDVIHFTGREIWRDPAKRAMEIRDQFRALLKPREGGRSRG